MATGNQTNITPPRVSLIDERTGAVSREWYRWFYSLFTTLGSGTGIVPVDAGGTGLGTIPTNGQLLIGNGTGYSLNTLGTGVGISVTNGLGTITVANTGVLSNIAGAGISVSGSTGNVTIANTGVLSFSGGTTGLTPAAATTGAVTLAGTLAIANGGTNGTSTPTAGAVPYGTGTAYAFTAAGTSGQVLTSAGAGVPTWATPTTGTVTSVGLAMPAQFAVTNSPVTTSGTLTAAWTTQSANVLLAGPTSGAGAVPTFRALTTADLPALPYGTGTVTSVGLSLPSIIAVTNSPVTTSGTLTGTLTTQSVNSIFAGPSSGAAAAPTFRALVTADIPSLSYVSSVGATAPITTTGGLTPTIGVTSAALAKTDDTNVTMTLSGAPTTALLAATTMALGWTGQLAVSRGGTGAALTTANFVFAGPTSGAPAAPTFRALTTADIPALAYGSVTSVSFTGGIVSVATPTTTPALTVAGTSGGVPYFSSNTTWASSAALDANAIVLGGGAGVAPATTTTGTGVVTALGVNVGSAGAVLVNGGVLGTPSSGTVTNLTGTASININGTVGATTPAAGTFTSLSDSGNLTFTGTGNRITGDFSNGTVANRLMLQTSTANSASRVGILPNGTSAAAELLVLNNSDTTNAGFGSIRMNASDFQITATYNGAGTYLPMTFYTGGSERVRINTSGLVGIGTSSPAVKLDVAGEIRSTGGTVQTFIEGSSGNGGYIGTRSNDYLQFRTNNADVMRIATGGIVTMSAYGAGAATFSATGVISSVSDETWKIKDGVPFDPDSMLKKLEPGYWYYNDEKKEIFGVDRQLGFYAQNVNAAIGPEAAPAPEEGKPWGYYDRSVLAITVMSLQKALVTIESLTARIEALESTVMKDKHDNINSTI